jgi:hypothetical protein
MKLQERKALLTELGQYLTSNEEAWRQVKQQAYLHNNWFTSEFIDLAVRNICENYLGADALQQFIETYKLPEENSDPKKVGIVMAGNIPMVGFHDLLCTFLAGHFAWIKFSSKDEVLMKHVVEKMIALNSHAARYLAISPMLKNCEAYIATGSNNSSRYFDYYFKNYPHIIRRNRTSVAILYGNENLEELTSLADDVYQYFGLGCRNVTKLFVPEGYDFVPLLDAFRKYDHLMHHHKYKNNYDYNLALHLLNHKYYMTNGSILLIEDDSPFSPISQLNYSYYSNAGEVRLHLLNDTEIQCVEGKNSRPFGSAQQPQLADFADGVDTMQFLMKV